MAKKLIPASIIDLYNNPTTVIGLKGLPGRPGLGVGHRPKTRDDWQYDEDYAKLIEWLGADDMMKVVEP